MTLDDLRSGETGRVRTIAATGALLQRLMQFGILEGTEMQLVRRAPTGDPIEYRLMGYSLSLRREEAKQIEIETRA